MLRKQPVSYTCELKCHSDDEEISPFIFTIVCLTQPSQVLLKPSLRTFFYEYPAATSPFPTGLHKSVVSSPFIFEEQCFNQKGRNLVRPFIAEIRFLQDVRVRSIYVEGGSCMKVDLLAFMFGKYCGATEATQVPDPNNFIELCSITVPKRRNNNNTLAFKDLPSVSCNCIQFESFMKNYKVPEFILVESTIRYVSSPSVDGKVDVGFPLDILPPEILLKILCYIEHSLQLKTILALSGVCKMLRGTLCDPLFYYTVNLRPFACIDISDNFIQFLTTRLWGTQWLTLSRLHSSPNTTSNMLSNVFCAPRCLNTVVMNGCQLLDDRSLTELTACQPTIKNLDISCCTNLTPKSFACIANLKHLEQLSVAHTFIEEPELVQIVSSCRKLEAVNFLSVRVNSRVCEKLAFLSPQLTAIRMRSRWVSGTVLMRWLMQPDFKFGRLEELHVPSTSSIGFGSELLNESFFRVLAATAPNLRSFVAGGVSRRDIEAFAHYSTKLEMLAVSFSPSLDLVTIKRLLNNCKNLKYLGISGVSLLTTSEINDLRRSFPNIRIETG